MRLAMSNSYRVVGSAQFSFATSSLMWTLMLCTRMAIRRACHFAMLFFALFERVRNALAPFLRQMTHEPHNAPHLVILEHALPARHAAEANAVFDDPLELPVFVLPNVLVAQVDHRWRHLGGKGNSGTMAIQAVTNLAVMLEVLFPGLHYSGSVVGRILPILATDLHLLNFRGE